MGAQETNMQIQRNRLTDHAQLEGAGSLTHAQIEQAIQRVSLEGLVLALGFNSDAVSGGAGSETCLDSSGQGNHLTNNGATHGAAAGFNGGGAFTFDGSDDRITGTALSEIAYANDYSVALWFKASNDTQNTMLFSNVSGAGEYCAIRCVSGTVRVGHYSAPSYHPASGAYTSGAWNHVVMVHDGTTGANTLYLDSVAQTGAQNPAAAATQILAIGADTSGAAANFAGLIDNVMVFSRALDSNEVAALYLTRAEVPPPRLKQVAPAAYQTISNPPTQAEVEALRDLLVSIGAMAAS